MNYETAVDDRTGLLYRLDTVDLAIVRGDAKGYLKRLPIEPDSRVLDIGAHIGGASYHFAKAGAALVVGVEADPSNYAMFERNVQPGHVALFGAAVGDSRPDATLWLNVRPRGTTLHSLTQMRGRESVVVPAWNFSDLVERYAITHVKIDCEGGEYDLLADDLAPSVRALVVEFHATHKTWAPRIAETLDHLVEQGFEPDRNPPTRPTPTAWVWTVAWRR